MPRSPGICCTAFIPVAAIAPTPRTIRPGENIRKYIRPAYDMWLPFPSRMLPAASGWRLQGLPAVNERPSDGGRSERRWTVGLRFAERLVRRVAHDEAQGATSDQFLVGYPALRPRLPVPADRLDVRPAGAIVLRLDHQRPATADLYFRAVEERAAEDVIRADRIDRIQAHGADHVPRA